MSVVPEKRFTKPSESKAFRSLLDAAVTAGHDRDALRRLLWLINAHPELISHAHVFQHIGAMLPLLENASLGPIDGWGTDIPAWRNFCEWADQKRDALATLPGLARFALQEKGSTGHPLLGEGVGRHGVVTALWSSHESLGKHDRYPPPEHETHAVRYFYLQAQLLRGYIEGRWKFSSLDHFEAYDRAKESPIAPALTGGPTLAMREFSFTRYDGFLAALDPTFPADEFNRQLLNFNGDVQQLSPQYRDDGLRYLASMKRFFRGVARVMSGRRPIRVTRRREFGGGGGGHKWRTGFVPARAPGVYLENPPPRKSDPDFQYSSAVRAWINPGDDPVDQLKNVELSGLAPSEVLESVFELISATEYQAAMQAERFKRLAIEGSAQYFPWGLENLTLGEQMTAWDKIHQAIAAYYGKPSNVSAARYRLIAGLALKFMMLFGQPVERARLMRIRWINPDAAFDPLDPPEIEYATLFCRLPATEGAAPKILGFGLPALSPDYATELDEELEELSRPIADGLILPDLSDLGEDLLRFVTLENRSDDRVFGIDPEKLSTEIKGLLRELDKRFTADKFERILATEIVKQSRDLVMVWIVTANQEARNEPRLFYSRKSLVDLRNAYSGAARALLRRVGFRPTNVLEPRIDGESFSIGARFVLRTDELAGLSSGLREKLKNWRREPCDRTEIIQYNNLYLFYTYLFQSIVTSIRAITQPVGLMQDWILAGSPKSGIQTGLSDKESRYFEKTRLVEILPELAVQYHHTHLHVQSLINRLNLERAWIAKSPEEQLLVVVDQDLDIEPVRPGWIEQQFKLHLGVAVPANFHRAFMRAELTDRCVPPEIIDAFLGHANHGESPFSIFSTFDYARALDVLVRNIREVLVDLGLEPIESRLVPYPTRLAMK